MRNAVLMFATVVLFSSCQPADQGEAPATPAAETESADPTVVAPNNYKVVLENDRVRVLQIQYAEGEETPMHSHPDAVALFLEDGTVEMRLPDGTSQQPTGKAGEALWTPAGAHSPKAVTPVSVLLVELKDGGGDESAMAEPSATDVAPDHYKVALKNAGFGCFKSSMPKAKKRPCTHIPRGSRYSSPMAPSRCGFPTERRSS